MHTEHINDIEDAQSNRTTPQSDIFIKRIKKFWWLFFLVGFSGGILGIWLAMKQKPVYQSIVTFALDEGGSEAGGMSGAASLAAQFGISLGGAKDVFSGENILEIMVSRRVIESVLLSGVNFENKPYTFIEYYLQKMDGLNKNKNLANLHFFPGENRKDFSYAKDSLLYNVCYRFQKEHVFVFKPNKKLNIFEVNVKTVNEKFTKEFTDRLIAATNQFYVEISSRKSKETLAILESRVPEMKNKLNASIGSQAAAQDANLNPAFASARVPLLKEQANAQVYGNAYGEMYKNLEMARFQYLKSIPLMQIIDGADYPMKKIVVSKIKSGLILFAAFVILGIVLFIIIEIFRTNRMLVK
jgi:hypothetical protein